MQASRALQAGHYTPMIKFIGKHNPPASLSHTPQPHPMAPSPSLPDSFANYRSKAQQHGPLNKGNNGGATHLSAAGVSQIAHGVIGGKSGHQLGSVKPSEGKVWDRSELPERFRRLSWAEGEAEAVESGGASRVW